MVKFSLQVGQKGRKRFTFGIAIRVQDITKGAIGAARYCANGDAPKSWSD